MLKFCYKCGKNKLTKSFHKNKSRSDNLQTRCKDCQNIGNKERYKNNREYWSARQMLNKRRRALLNYAKIVTEYFIQPCADCGKIYHPSAMVFDHKDPELKRRIKRRSSQGVFGFVRDGYSWKVILNEINKCEVRCQNCHYSKTSVDFEYWNEIRKYVDDFYKVIQIIYDKNGNLSDNSLFKEKRRELAQKYYGFMTETINVLINEKKSKLSK